MKQVFIKIGIALLILGGGFLFIVSLYTAEIQKYGIGIYLKTYIIACFVITLISLTSQLIIKNPKAAFIVSAVIAPIPFCVYSYFACSRDWQCEKWLPVAWIFITIISEVILGITFYTIRSILRITKKR